MHFSNKIRNKSAIYLSFILHNKSSTLYSIKLELFAFCQDCWHFGLSFLCCNGNSPWQVGQARRLLRLLALSHSVAADGKLDAARQLPLKFTPKLRKIPAGTLSCHSSKELGKLSVFQLTSLFWRKILQLFFELKWINSATKAKSNISLKKQL